MAGTSGRPMPSPSAPLNGVTLWDVAVERQVEITGPDAARFTQLLTPRDNFFIELEVRDAVEEDAARLGPGVVDHALVAEERKLLRHGEARLQLLEAGGDRLAVLDVQQSGGFGCCGRFS